MTRNIAFVHPYSLQAGKHNQNLANPTKTKQTQTLQAKGQTRPLSLLRRGVRRHPEMGSWFFGWPFFSSENTSAYLSPVWTGLRPVKRHQVGEAEPPGWLQK